MNTRALAHRRTWSLFVGSAIVLIVAMTALSFSALRSERRELAANVADAHAARLREAVAAMDRWLGPVLAREAGRHHADYAAYRAPRRAFTQELERLPPGSVVEPSPLLGYSAETILLHFEWSAESGAHSPQAPVGRERELALSSGLPPQLLQQAEERMAAILPQIDLPELARSLREQASAVSLSEQPREQPGEPPLALRRDRPQVVDQTSCLVSDELREDPLAAGLLEDAGGASVGALVPRWFAEDGLLFARDVRAGSHGVVQGVVADWPALSRLLLEEAAKDLPGARLVRAEDAPGVSLSTIPASLVADAPAPPVMAWTPLRTRLSVAWLAGLVSLGAIGFALRTSIAHAERGARFAAAMSHELRTPLTTLRLYSEMLADGIITDPSVRQEYLETIQAESARLASLVENVLLHARIEQTSAHGRRRMTVGQLVESIAPVLRRRADAATRPLIVEMEAELDRNLEVEVDRDAVERVLFNLVDNACKHGVESDGESGVARDDKTLRLGVRRRANFVDLDVRDQGPGIPRALGSAVFEAFRRGDEAGAPGAGLGLALSRSLARELRGELSLVPSERGACFRLSLRLA